MVPACRCAECRGWADGFQLPNLHVLAIFSIFGLFNYPISCFFTLFQFWPFWLHYFMFPHFFTFSLFTTLFYILELFHCWAFRLPYFMFSHFHFWPFWQPYFMFPHFFTFGLFDYPISYFGTVSLLAFSSTLFHILALLSTIKSVLHFKEVVVVHWLCVVV